jgi:hypothetical protein
MSPKRRFRREVLPSNGFTYQIEKKNVDELGQPSEPLVTLIINVDLPDDLGTAQIHVGMEASDFKRFVRDAMEDIWRIQYETPNVQIPDGTTDCASCGGIGTTEQGDACADCNGTGRIEAKIIDPGLN